MELKVGFTAIELLFLLRKDKTSGQEFTIASPSAFLQDLTPSYFLMLGKFLEGTKANPTWQPHTRERKKRLYLLNCITKLVKQRDQHLPDCLIYSGADLFT